MRSASVVLVFVLISAINLLPRNLTWKTAGGNSWGPVLCMAVDKNGYYYAGITNDLGNQDRCNIIRSKDEGLSWETIIVSPKNMIVKQIFIAQNGYIFLVADNNPVYISKNDGITWESLKIGDNKTDIRGIAQSSDGTLFACAYPDGMYCSRDSGLTWELKSKSIGKIDKFKKFFIIHDVIFRSDNYNLYKSTDYGDSWKKIYIIENIGEYYCVNYNQDRVYLCTHSSLCYLDYSQDSVTLQHIKGLSRPYLLIVNSDNNVFIANSNEIFKYDSTLADWVHFTVLKEGSPFNTAYFNCFEFIDNKAFIGTKYGDLYICNKDITDYKIVNINLSELNITGFEKTSRGVCYVISNNSYIYHSVDSCNNWYPILVDTIYKGKIRKICTDTSQSLYALIDDIGYCQIKDNSKIIKRDGGIGSDIQMIASDDKYKAYAITNEGFYKYLPADTSWVLINTSLAGTRFLNDKKKILITTDYSKLFLFNTETKEVINISIGETIEKITCADIDDNGHIFIGTKGKCIWKTENQGKDWKMIDRQLSTKTISDILCAGNNTVLAGSINNGVFFSNQGGEIWEKNSQGLNSMKINSLEYYDDSSFIAYTETGIYKTDPVLDSEMGIQYYWVDSLNYKQQKSKVNPISKLKISKDGQRFYTYSGDFYRIWDIETGMLINEIGMPSGYSKIDIDIHQNERWFIISTAEPWTFPNNNTYLYDFIEDSCLLTIKADIGYSSSGQYPVTILNNSYVMFNEEQNCIINGLKVYYDAGSTNQNTGRIGVFDLDSGKILVSYGTDEPQAIYQSPDMTLLYCLCYYHYYSSPSHGGKNEYRYSGRIIDLKNQKYKMNEYLSAPVCFSYDNKYIAYFTYPNKIDIYNIDSSRLEKAITIDGIYNDKNDDSKDNIVIDLEFSMLNYNLFVTTNNYLYCCDFNKCMVIDSIPFNTPGVKWQIELTGDNKHLIATSNNGLIRLYEIDRITSVTDSYKSQKHLFIYPNPANSTLTITLDNDYSVGSMIEIYNSLGQSVSKNSLSDLSLTGNNQYTLNIESLSSGIYYIVLKHNSDNMVGSAFSISR